MGCDIHCFAEKRNKQTGKWEKIGDVFKNAYYNPEKEQTDYNTEFTDSPYQGRNYDLFGILADVRNGRGFAGIKTGEGFNPISMPKGIPEDVSSEILAESDTWGDDGHSHSFLTVREIEEYDWNQTTMLTGVISLKEFNEMVSQASLKPLNGYSGHVSGSGIEIITKEDALESRIPENKNVFVRVNWEESYNESVGSFLTKSVPALKSLCDLEDIYGDNVRIVFWFDN